MEVHEGNDAVGEIDQAIPQVIIIRGVFGNGWRFAGIIISHQVRQMGFLFFLPIKAYFPSLGAG